MSRSSGSRQLLVLDIGTSSVRIGLYNDQAKPTWQRRSSYPSDVLQRGVAQAGAQRLALEVFHLIDDAYAASTGEFSGVAVTSFWHSLVGLDRMGLPITPIYLWNDQASSTEAKALQSEYDEDLYRKRTGSTFHPSFSPAKILHLAKDHAEVFDSVTHWVTFTEYLYLRLFGDLRVSVSMASGTGLFRQEDLVWDREVLDLARVRENQLSPICDDQLIGLKASYAARWPELAGIPWFPAIGDGAADSLGHQLMAGEATLTLGTSGAIRLIAKNSPPVTPKGLFRYRLDDRCSVVGGSLSDGGNLREWILSTLRTDEAAIFSLPPDVHGLTVLPLFSGERSIGWHADAQGVVAGLLQSTTPVELGRALLESLGYRFSAILERCRIALPIDSLVASGGALARSDNLVQMMSDILEIPIARSDVQEASSRGAAIWTWERLGLEVPTARRIEVFSPNHEYQAAYQEGRRRHEELYQRWFGGQRGRP